jgi:hypothetical protein
MVIPELESLAGWPDEKHRITSVEFIHAFGQLSLAYNYLEDCMGLIFGRFLPINLLEAEALYHRLNNFDRMSILTGLVTNSSESDEIKSHVLHLIECYDICTENRNILMHSIVFPKDGITRLLKRARRDTARTVRFDVRTQDLQNLADTTMEILDGALKFDLWFVQGRFPQRPEDMARTMGWPEPPAPVPFPSRPPKPRKLVPYQPPEVPKGDSPPLPS